MEIVRKELRECADSEKAKILQGFFKTGKGDYGEGDVFLGVSVPNSRRIARGAVGRVGLEGVEELLGSEFHEERLVGVLILVELFASRDDRGLTTEDRKKEIYDFYLRNSGGINNWDLVDLSAPKIVGAYLASEPKRKSSASLEKFSFAGGLVDDVSEDIEVKRDRGVLYELALSENLWDRRIAIVSTFAFIRENEFDDTLRIAKVLLADEHDLIHKAVGWMLREVGKRDGDLLRKFLRENYSCLPRVTLRYAIERFPVDERVRWLRGDYLIFL